MITDMSSSKLTRSAHLMFVITFTVLGTVMGIQGVLLGWERWVLILIPAEIIVSWLLHIQQPHNPTFRLWVYTSFIMFTLFFYGIHIRNILNVSILYAGVLILSTTTGKKAVVTFAQITYYLTVGYNVYTNNSPDKTDINYILQVIVHLTIITLMSWLGRDIISKWEMMIEDISNNIEKLNESTDRLDDFLAATSHELRTPVGAILGLSENCLEKTDDEAMRSELLLIKDAGLRISRQVNDVLDFSELDRDRLVATPGNYLFSALMDDVVTALKPYLTTDVELILDIDPSIPSIMYADSNKIKRVLWHLIMNGLKYTITGCVYVHIFSEEQDYGVNLIIDVIDTGIGMSEKELSQAKERFYQADSGKTRARGGLGIGIPIVEGFVKAMGGFIHIESEPDKGTKVHVCIPQGVLDGANCVSLDDPDKINLGAYFSFNKYPVLEVREYYGSMITNVVKGMGVSVHGVDSINELKRVIDTTDISHLFIGMKEYESDPDYIESLTDKLIVFLTADKGYQLPEDSNIRFFEKPLYCFPIISALNSGITDIEKNVQMTCPGLKALIVDDEPMNLKVANDIFGKYQMTATTASSGSKAIEMCKEEHFDIIFMDYMMPEIDGIETARRIRANIVQGQPIPLFVAVTANDVSSVRELFNKEGFDGFVGKPVNKIEIESVLKNILSPSQIKYVNADKIKRTTVATKPRPKKAGNASFESTLKKLGVIIDSGLKYCQNDMDMYKEIVMDLASRAKDYVVEADILFNDNKPEEYAIKLHAIKGLFKMIGANDMSDKAYTLEKAGKGGNIDDVKELHTEVMNWYLSFADKVN